MWSATRAQNARMCAVDDLGLVDCASMNGLYVNGERCQRTRCLCSGDEIVVGQNADGRIIPISTFAVAIRFEEGQLSPGVSPVGEPAHFPFSGDVRKRVPHDDENWNQSAKRRQTNQGPSPAAASAPCYELTEHSPDQSPPLELSPEPAPLEANRPLKRTLTGDLSGMPVGHPPKSACVIRRPPYLSISSTADQMLPTW